MKSLLTTVLLLLCGAGLLLLVGRKQQPLSAVQDDRLLGLVAGKPVDDDSASESNLRMRVAYARVLTENGRWREARILFADIAASHPGYGGGYLQQYIALCDVEIPTEQHLRSAEGYLEEHRLAEAALELKAIPSDSAQADRRDSLGRRLDAALALEAPNGTRPVPSQATRR